MASLRTALLSLLLAGSLGGCGSDEVPVTPGRAMGAPPAAAVAEEARPQSGGAALDSRFGVGDRAAESAAVRENQAPTIVAVLIEPFGEVTTRHDIVAKPQANDINGDDIEFRYTWQVNGVRAFSGEDTLPKTDFRRGDRIELTVVASDGTLQSEPLASKPFEVTNAAPIIISSPGGLDESKTFRYQIEVDDPDDKDGFRYRLQEGPDGMEVDAETGLLSWQPTMQQTGTHPTRIEVVDSKGGKAWQSFDFEMDLVADTPPAAPAPK